MNIQRLEILLKTIDLGSLTKASQVMDYTQSAISHIVASLEDELGVKLLIRGRDGVRPTEEAKLLLPAIRTIVHDGQELKSMASALRGMEIGTVRIGTFLSISTHFLPQVIRAFSEEHPNIEFELLQGNYYDIEQWIYDGRVDVGFLRGPSPDAFEAFPVVKEQFLAIFPADRALDDGPFHFEDVKNESYILRPDTLDSELSKLLKQVGYRPKITYSAKDDFAIMAMVEQGLGMSILAELLMKGTNYHIQKRPLQPPVYREICLAYKSTQALSPAARQFVALTKRYCAENPPIIKTE